MSQRLKDKVALVVGAGSVGQGDGWGNGKAAAVLYAREGARVLCVDRDIEAARQTCAVIESEGGSALAYAADVSRPREVQAMVEECVARFDRIDVLHNNVGIEDVSTLDDLTEENWDRVHAVNLKSVVFACKYAVPHMRRQRGGAIVNISSIASIRWGGVPYWSYYTSKAALNQFTRAFARQYARDGVRANVILPGLIDTPHVRTKLSGTEQEIAQAIEARNRRCPMGFMGSPWDVAKAALFLVSDDARYITGAELVVDGGVTL